MVAGYAASSKFKLVWTFAFRVAGLQAPAP